MACAATSSWLFLAASRRGNSSIEQARKDGRLAAERAAGGADQVRFRRRVRARS